MFNFDKYKGSIGSNIRKERIARDISTAEFAKLLDCSTATVRLIERGERGVTTENLIKISKIFGKSLDSLVFDYKKPASVNESSDDKRITKKRETLKSLIYDLSEGEIDFIIETVRSLRAMTKNNSEKDIKY